MEPSPRSTLTRMAARVRTLKRSVVESITEEFILSHPGWLAEHGEKGRQHCITDTSYHVDFLTGALESGEPAAFADYITWAVRVLHSYHIPAAHLDENLRSIHRTLLPHLTGEERKLLDEFVNAGRLACAAGCARVDGDRYTEWIE